MMVWQGGRTHRGFGRGTCAASSQHGLRAFVLAGFLGLALAPVLAPAPAYAVANAIITPTHYADNSILRGDDTNNLVVALPFTMNWLGSNYSQIYINMNGNCTFVDPYCDSNHTETYKSHELDTTQYYNTPNPYLPIIAPFFADVDTSNLGSGQASYSATTTPPTFNGHNCFIVNWINVMSYVDGTHSASPNTNSFQMVLVDRSDTGAGNFDLMFNYNTVNWDTGAANANQDGRAVAGWSTAQGTNSFYELPGSLAPMAGPSALLDSSSSSTSLIQNSLNSGGVLGRYIWTVRNGAAPNSLPVITVANHVLEGNSSTGYTGYAASGDATATDVDGSIWALTNNCPATLPLGTTNVTWTATDNQGAVATATESITVTDTTAPSNPSLVSPTHAVGVWSSNPTVTVNGASATDVCSGLRGFSYSWSQNSPSTPDTAIDACTTSTTSATTTSTVSRTDTMPVGVDTFPNNVLPSAWTSSDPTYVRMTTATGHNHGTDALEIYTNNTRRTLNAYRDYNLSGLASATVTFWDNVSALTGGSDYSRVEYSTDGGTTYTQLRNVTAISAWSSHTYNLPVGGTVRLRFSASVNAATEYADWDDIVMTGWKTTTSTISNTTTLTSLGTTTTPGEGTWYFNLRTVDAAGNWSAATSYGPVDIDTVKPSTSSNAPSSWASATVNVSLTATDPSGPVAYTRYKLDAAAVATFTVPIAVSGDGTHTLLFWSADLAGNVEATRSATILVDTTGPSVPTSIGASAVSTTSIEVTWAPSTDSVSGIAYYAVYRNGSLVATTTATVFTDTGRSPGTSYPYYIVAYNGSGMKSANSATATGTTPAAEIWMSLSTDNVNMGGVSPGLASTLTSATTVKVGGVGNLSYDLSCSALDFSNAATASVTPTMSVSTLSYATNGWITAGAQPFQLAPYKLDTSTGSKYVWEHDYRFDYVLNPAWANDPGTYTTTVLYTVVSH